MAMNVSSSMIRTSVAISAASSRPDSFNQTPQRRQIAVENSGRVLLGEAFEGHQQESLARPGGDLGEVLLWRRVRLSNVAFAVHFDRIPDLCEQVIERNSLIRNGFQHFRAGDQRFQGRRDVSVARRLATGERAGVAAKKRQMLKYGLRCRQGHTLPVSRCYWLERQRANKVPSIVPAAGTNGRTARWGSGGGAGRLGSEGWASKGWLRGG